MSPRASREEVTIPQRGVRVKVGHEYDAAMSDGFYDQLFNAPGRAFSPVLEKVCRTSSYYPAPVIVSLAREQVRRCLAELNEKKLRSLTAGLLYNFQVLAHALELPIADPKLRQLAQELLPAELSSRL